MSMFLITGFGGDVFLIVTNLIKIYKLHYECHECMNKHIILLHMLSLLFITLLLCFKWFRD